MTTDTDRLPRAREFVSEKLAMSQMKPGIEWYPRIDVLLHWLQVFAAAEVKAAVEWTPVSERLPEVEAGQVGVEVWITYLKPESANAIVFKGHYTTSDATGFRWWRDVNPLGISDRGVESVLGGRILAWKYCEKKPQPYQPKEEQDAAKMS